MKIGKKILRMISNFPKVTWEEIRTAERLRDKFMEFELYDIFERASIYGRELEDVIEENIKYILKREELYDEKKLGDVVIPAGALYWECDEEGRCFVTGTFEVFDKSGNKVLARGSISGTMFLVNKETAELSDIAVSIPVEDVKALKRLIS